eukprot:PITA_06094
MVEEYDSIVQKSVWDVVPRPEDKLVVSCHWFYKVNQVVDGSVEKNKARFVGRGFSQVEGIDYDETFAPVARYSSIKSILAQSVQMGWSIHHMDVNIASLNGMIEEEGIDSYLTGLGFMKSEADVKLYHIVVEGKIFIIVLYVYDFIPIGDEKLIKSCKEDLAREFEMKDMGLMYYFLGLEVWQGDRELFVSQGKYANEILRRFRMESSKPMENPLAVNQLSQAMVRPTKMYWKVAKHVLRYLRGTTQFGLWYRWTEGVKLQGFIDADWVGSPSNRKNTSGGIFSIGLATISWYNRKER